MPNFVETKQSLLTCTGFWRSQTVLFTREFLCYQTEKAKSKNKLSWRQMPHLSIMLSLSKALLSPRDFIFSFRAQSCSQEFGCQQHPFFPGMLLHTSQLKAVARNSDSSIRGYPRHRLLLCPLPASAANPLLHCSQAHFRLWTLHKCVVMQTEDGWCW